MDCIHFLHNLILESSEEHIGGCRVGNSVLPMTLELTTLIMLTLILLSWKCSVYRNNLIGEKKEGKT